MYLTRSLRFSPFPVTIKLFLLLQKLHELLLHRLKSRIMSSDVTRFQPASFHSDHWISLAKIPLFRVKNYFSTFEKPSRLWYAFPDQFQTLKHQLYFVHCDNECCTIYNAVYMPKRYKFQELHGRIHLCT